MTTFPGVRRQGEGSTWGDSRRLEIYRAQDVRYYHRTAAMRSGSVVHNMSLRRERLNGYQSMHCAVKCQ